MEDLISGATTFARTLRFDLCKKQKQVFKKNIYAHKIWGSQIKGGLEVCDAIVMGFEKDPVDTVEEFEKILTDWCDLFKKELDGINLEDSIQVYTEKKVFQTYKTSSKTKIDASVFARDIRIAVLRGSYLACAELLQRQRKEPTINPEVMLGDVHIVRMNLWNKYRGRSKVKLRKLDVMDTMQVSPRNLTLN